MPDTMPAWHNMSRCGREEPMSCSFGTHGLRVHWAASAPARFKISVRPGSLKRQTLKNPQRFLERGRSLAAGKASDPSASRRSRVFAFRTGYRSFDTSDCARLANRRLLTWALPVHENHPPCRFGIFSRLVHARRLDTITDMDTLIIAVSWEYFIGIMGALIAIAYHTNGRFTALETDVGWLREMISELVIRAENVTAKLFKNDSPVSLTAAGYSVLQRSGLRSYIDAKRPTLLAALKIRASSDPYEIQRRAFRLIAELPFDDAVGRHLNSFAFNNGMSTSILRRVGAVYLRDLAVKSG